MPLHAQKLLDETEYCPPPKSTGSVVEAHPASMAQALMISSFYHSF
nr:MAG TPA: hypothetical protein [Caudoviricetes sp.]